MCSWVCGTCVRAGLQTSGDSSLTTIISDLQSAQPAKAQGHLWTQTFPSFLSQLFYSFLSVSSSSPAILSRHVMLWLFPRSFSLLRPLYFHHFPRPKPRPPLTLCLLSVNSFFLFLVCWPRLTYFSLSLFQLSRLLSRSLSPSLCLCPSVSLVPFHLPSLSLGNAKNQLHMCTHKHTHAVYCKFTYRKTSTHTRTES